MTPVTLHVPEGGYLALLVPQGDLPCTDQATMARALKSLLESVAPGMALAVVPTEPELLQAVFAPSGTGPVGPGEVWGRYVQETGKHKA